jgi:hypothetical protein
MPCDASYMNPNHLEKNISRLHCLLQELETGKHVDPASSAWTGYHPAVYNQHPTQADADKLTALLCSKLKTHLAISKCSLELQIWWRNHLAADQAREAKEKKDPR